MEIATTLDPTQMCLSSERDLRVNDAIIIPGTRTTNVK